MARYTVCHDHEVEALEANTKTIADLFFSDPSVMVATPTGDGDMFRLAFAQPLVVSKDGKINEIFCDGRTLNLFELNTLGTMEPVYDGAGAHGNFTLICQALLNNRTNGWVNEEYREKIRLYFAELDAIGFDAEASAAFKRMQERREAAKTPPPSKGTLFGHPRKSLNDALAAAVLFIRMDTALPAVKGSKRRLADAIKKAEQGKFSWGKSASFYLMAVNEPFNIPSPTGAPIMSRELESHFYFVENTEPYRVFELLVFDRDFQNETDQTELCWCIGSISDQKPFDLAKIQLHPIKSRSEELTFADLFAAICEDPRLKPLERKVIEKSGVLAIGKNKKKEHAADEEELYSVPHTKLYTTLHMLLNSPRHIEGGKNNLLQKKIEDDILYPNITSIIYNDSSYEGDRFKLKIPDFDKLFPRSVQNGSKVLDIVMRAIQQANMAETVMIPLSRFVGEGMYSDEDSARKGIKNICEKLIRTISSGEVWGIEDGKRRKKAFAEAVVVSSYAITNSELTISLSEIWRQQAPYFTMLPEFALELEDNGYTLLRYIMERARQTLSNGEINIRLEAVRVRLGLPSPEEVPRKISEKIREPIERAMEAIESKQLDKGYQIVSIEERHEQEPKTAREWLSGYLIVKVAPDVMARFETIKANRQKALSSGKKKAAKPKPS